MSKLNPIKNTIAAFVLIFGTLSPFFAHAGDLTLPVNADPTNDISAWFDHNSSGGSFQRYDGDTTDNYDGHEGTDFATSTGAGVLAPASGEVKEVYWDNCGGWQMHVWHENIGISTLYSHLGTTTSATTTDIVSRGEHIADVDITGSCTSGAHLHFGVTDGEDRTTSNRIDPFGWSGGGSDPWTYNLGYLWTTTPPSFGVSEDFEDQVFEDCTNLGTAPTYITSGSAQGGTYKLKEGAGTGFCESDLYNSPNFGTATTSVSYYLDEVSSASSQLYWVDSSDNPVFMTQHDGYSSTIKFCRDSGSGCKTLGSDNGGWNFIEVQVLGSVSIAKINGGSWVRVNLTNFNPPTRMSWGEPANRLNLDSIIVQP